MPHMQKILAGIKIDELLEQIQSSPDLWDRYDFRTHFYDNSPHREVSDIWLRYNDWSNFDTENPSAFSSKHESVYYSAYYELPAVKAIMDGLMTIVDGAELGGCLITKIPPGKRVYRHSDAGHWHSEYYLSKYLITLQSAPGQVFEFDNESHEAEAGDLFIFDNRPEHWVINDSAVDRISLICAIRQKTHNDQ